MPACQIKIIEQAIFIFSPLAKGFEKQIKKIEDQLGAIEDNRVNAKKLKHNKKF